MTQKKFLPGILILIFSFFVFYSCSKKEKPVFETCSDKIKNQNEINIDCGGVCKPCPESMTAKINGSAWEADTAKINASYSSVGTKFLLSGNTTAFYPQISLVYLGDLSLGSHDLNHSSSFTLNISSMTSFVTSGTLNISEIDT